MGVTELGEEEAIIVDRKTKVMFSSDTIKQCRNCKKLLYLLHREITYIYIDYSTIKGINYNCVVNGIYKKGKCLTPIIKLQYQGVMSSAELSWSVIAWFDML